MSKPFCVNCSTHPTDNCWIEGHLFSWNWEYDEDTDKDLTPKDKLLGTMRNVVALDLKKTEVKFGDIDAKYEGEHLIFKAKIIAVKNIKTYNFSEYWYCPKCYSADQYYANKLREINVPPTCEECGLRLINDRSKNGTANVRELLLQEIWDEATQDVEGNTMPRTMEAEVFGKFVFGVHPGQDKMFNAVLRSRPTKDYNRMVLEICNYKDIEEKTDLTVSDADKRVFASYQEDRIISSFAPEIWGMKYEKLALILGILGGVKKDGLRGLINIMLVGDPSMGKSKMLSFATKMLRRAAKVSGRMVSGAGLIAGIDEKDGNRYPVIGPVGMCHGGLVAIDESDKMREDDKSGLHDVMEEGKIRLNKIGVNLVVPAETTIFMGANPRKSRYDPEATIKENINIPESLMSRMGLIFCCRDNLPKSQEELKVKHVGRVRKIGVTKLIEEDNLIDQPTLMKFLNYCRSFEPELTDEAIERANKYYLDLKYVTQSKPDTIPIDIRTDEDILRISMAFAKLSMSDKVMPEHVDRAWNILEKALQSFEMQTVGEMHQSQVLTKDMNKEDALRHCITQCTKDDKVRHNDIIMAMLQFPKHWKSKEAAEREFEKIRMGYGLLQTGTNGVYSCQ